MQEPLFQKSQLARFGRQEMEFEPTRTSVGSKEPNRDIVPWHTSVDNISLRRIHKVINTASSRSDNREFLLYGREHKRKKINVKTYSVKMERMLEFMSVSDSVTVSRLLTGPPCWKTKVVLKLS